MKSKPGQAVKIAPGVWRARCGWPECGHEWTSVGQKPPTRCPSPYTRRDGSQSGGCGRRDLRGPKRKPRHKKFTDDANFP